MTGSSTPPLEHHLGGGSAVQGPRRPDQALQADQRQREERGIRRKDGPEVAPTDIVQLGRVRLHQEHPNHAQPGPEDQRVTVHLRTEHR